MELRQALRLKVGRRLAEADRRKINLHDVAAALGVTERTLRNWRTSAVRGAKKQGRPRTSDELVQSARTQVFELMKAHGSPGWRPIAAELNEKVPVRLVQKLVSEYKKNESQRKLKIKRMTVAQKNIIWTLDGAFTKVDGIKVENQVLKDRGSLAWIGHEANLKASKAENVVYLVRNTGLKNGYPLVLSTDNGAAYKSSEFKDFLNKNRVIHLRSLPRTPQQNGSVETGIRELRQIMEAKESDLAVALRCANERLRRFGSGWSSANLVYEEEIVPYTELDREEFYQSCVRRLEMVQELPVGFRKRRLMEREIIINELEARGYLKRWESTKNG